MAASKVEMPSLAIMSMPMLLLRIVSMRPEGASNSIGMLTLLKKVSFCISSPSPLWTLVRDTRSYCRSISVRKRAEFERFLKLCQSLVSSISGTRAAAPLHCLSRYMIILTHSVVWLFRTWTLSFTLYLTCMLVILIVRPVRCELEEVPSGTVFIESTIIPPTVGVSPIVLSRYLISPFSLAIW